MRYIRVILVIVLVTSFVFTLSCKKAIEKMKSGSEELINVDLTGLYSIKGTNPDNTQYEGSLKITKNGEVYEGTWETAGSTYDGTGIRQGNNLIFAFADSERTFFGVGIYQIEKSGALNGEWAIYNVEGLGYEVACKSGVTPPTVKFVPQPPVNPIENTYNFEGSNTDGSQYSGTVSLQKGANYYDITWKDTQGNQFVGIGIPHKDIFAVATAEPTPPNFGVCVYKLVAPDKMEGVWTGNTGEGKIAKEKWTK